MPVHDWSKVEAGIFHSFHHFWLTTITTTLNGAVLPERHYALPDQVAGPGHPDVLGHQRRTRPDPIGSSHDGGPATALLTAPTLQHEDTSDKRPRARSSKRVSVRHASGDRVVALVEIVSRSNKDGPAAAKEFATKLGDYLVEGVHLLVADLHPPGRADPNGIHPLIGKPFKRKVRYTLQPTKPLTLAAYAAGDPAHA